MASKPTFDSLKRKGIRRVLPKRHIFHILLQPKAKRYRAQTGVMDDDPPSSRIVRVLVVILLLHILVIGAVCLQGRLTKNSSAGAQTTGMSLPPVAAPANPSPVRAPQTARMTASPRSSSGIGAPEVHITDPSTIVRPAGGSSGSLPAVQAGSAVHLVTSGETWDSIAAMNGCSEADLRAVNPVMASHAQPISGERLQIPAKPGETVPVALEAPDECSETFYTLKRGDTLSKVARMYKTSVSRLMKLNNLTEKDVSRLTAGRRIQVTGDAPVPPPASDGVGAASGMASLPAAAATAPESAQPLRESRRSSAPEKPRATGVYILKKGETLAAVARKHKTTTAELFRLNNLDDRKARRLQPGAKIKVPR